MSSVNLGYYFINHIIIEFIQQIYFSALEDVLDDNYDLVI